MMNKPMSSAIRTVPPLKPKVDAIKPTLDLIHNLSLVLRVKLVLNVEG